jgi:hypothetical protein
VTTAPREEVASTVKLSGTFTIDAEPAGGDADGGEAAAPTVTVKLACALFPCVSVAVQVTVVVAIGNVDPEAGTQVTGRVPSIASIAVGFVYVTTAPLGPVAVATMLAGMPLKTGGVVSPTVTVKLACALFPCVSVAVQVTVVVAIGNMDPESGTQVTGRLPSTASVAVGYVYVTTAPLGPVAVAAILAGVPVKTGGVVSTTVTVKPFVI